MGLKNKEERQNYFYYNEHWNMIGDMCNENIVLHKLNGYPIVRLSWILDFKDCTTNYFKGDIAHYSVLGYYEINPDYTLKSIYNMSFNQCIDLMTKCDKEGK